MKIHLEHLQAQKLLALVASMLFLFLVILVVRYQFMLINYIEWGDESETIVAAKMISNGMVLYLDIFNHHGPLTFLPGLVVEKINNYGIQAHRIPIIALQWLALLAIYLSPILNTYFFRNIFTGIFASIMVLYLPEIYGHMYMYQVMAGLFLVVILAQYTLPSVIASIKVSALNVAVGNILIGSLPFLAVTYIPAAALIFIASINKVTLRASFMWLFVGVAANLLFLSYIGSLRGYWAYHFYLNGKILPHYFRYGEQNSLQLLHSSIVNTTNHPLGFILLSLALSSVAVLASREASRIPWRSILVAFGIFSLAIRGGLVWGMHALAFLYATMALILLYVSGKEQPRWQAGIFYIILLLVCLLKLSLLLPGDRNIIPKQKIQDSTEFSQLAQQITRQDERIIAYSFNNFEYIAANRLPASGHYFYLPWQEKYNENMQFGIGISACNDIKKSKPKIMMIDKWMVWGRYPWESYAGCVQQVIDDSYKQIPDRPYYVRRDLFFKKGNDTTPFNLTNQHLIHGILIKTPGFIVKNSIDNQLTFKNGLLIRFADGSTREVVKKEFMDPSLIIHLDGGVLAILST